MIQFQEHPGKHVADIEIYALSTCPYCNRTKAYLNSHDIEYKYVNVDEVPAAEAEEAMEAVEQYSSNPGFPTIVVNGGKEVIIGFNEPKIAELIGA